MSRGVGTIVQWEHGRSGVGRTAAPGLRLSREAGRAYNRHGCRGSSGVPARRNGVGRSHAPLVVPSRTATVCDRSSSA